MTFVVTGASGFLGRAVVAELARRRQPVIAASRSKVIFDAAVRTLQIKDYTELQPSDSHSILVHLAEPRDIAVVEAAGDAHIAATQGLLRTLLAQPWDHAVYISSVAVHGASRSVYARAKAACERETLARNGCVVRLANVYGPGMAPNNVLSDILSQVTGDGPLRVRDTDSRRDYVWIADAARGIADAAQRRLRCAVDLGTGRGVSVGELAQRVLALAGQSHRPILATAPPPQPSELVANPAAAAGRLGWKAAIPLEQGLAILVNQPR